jgi:hypothetical protein
MESLDAICNSQNNDLLYRSLIKYYNKPHSIGSIEKVVSIIDGTSMSSLRLIDWFVTNYAKKHNIVIHKIVNGEPEYFNVYLNYRAQLKAFSKRFFDPFRRRNRISYSYNKGKDTVNTTIGQLAFFRWAIQNSIIDYIESDENFTNIERDMIDSQKCNGSDRQAEVKSKVVIDKTSGAEMIIQRKKRNELSDCRVRRMTTYEGKTTVSFD